MAVLGASPDGVVLSSAQTGNGDSTNTVFRPYSTGVASVVIANTGGATPTVTIAVLGSVDGTNFYNIPYARQATPTTFAVATFAVTTTATETITLQGSNPWRYLKLNYTANTNETLTVTAYV